MRDAHQRDPRPVMRVPILITLFAVLLGVLAPFPAWAQELFVSIVVTNQVRRYNGTTGAFIDAIVAFPLHGGGGDGGGTHRTSFVRRPDSVGLLLCTYQPFGLLTGVDLSVIFSAHAVFCS